MKTTKWIGGAMIVAISAFLHTHANAQTPTVKVFSGATKDIIKVMFHGKPNGVVTVRFEEQNGVSIFSDKIKVNDPDKGFLKTYKVDREPSDFFWIEVSDKDLFVRYKVSSTSSDEWLAQLEKDASNYPVIVSNKPKQ